MNINTIRTAWRTANDFGLRWTLRRLRYEWQLRTGHHKRRLPSRAWRPNEITHWLKDEVPANKLLENWRASKANFFFSTQNQAAMAAAMNTLSPELEVTANSHQPRYFSKLAFNIELPKIWFTNPFHPQQAQCAKDKHWSEYPMYSAEYEDLKFVWEYGRFAIVYDLVRRYFLNRDETLAEQYWQLVESWIEHNPPHTGPHWKCGQETSLRLMAWYVGLYAFVDCPATTSQRFELFMAAVAAQADRVLADWEYSYLQQSNHAVSEGLGLYVTGLLFPQFKQAAEWRKTGKHILEERSTFLFRSDGTYFQKSHNYLRFIIHAYLYVIRVAEVNGDGFSDTLKDRMRAALDYLLAVIDRETGYVPNFGSNDGALILPFNSCDFRDFRPTVAALHYYFHQQLALEPGPWNEDLLWLFGPEAITQDHTPLPDSVSRRFDVSGIYTLRSKESWAFTHAETFVDRPAHADALHLDLWWRGINICCDPGTYLYYGHTPWLDAFKHTRFHNTITVDGKDQMERAYRFTWGYWHHAQLNNFRSEGDFQHLEVEHDGYQRLDDPVIHRRAILAIADYWIVIDDVIGAAEHEVKLHWLLADFPYKVKQQKIIVDSPKGQFTLGVFELNQHAWDQDNKGILAKLSLDVVRGNKDSGTRGWVSNYYGHKAPALSIEAACKGKLPQRFVSCLGAEGWSLLPTGDQLLLNIPNQTISIQLNKLGEQNIIKNLEAMSREFG